MIKKIIPFFIILIACWACGVAANYFINGSIFSTELLFNPTSLYIGGFLFLAYVLYKLIKYGDDTSSSKPSAKSVGKTSSGQDLKFYSDSRWITEKELKTESKFRHYLYSDLHKCKNDGIVIRSELTRNVLDINMYDPIHTLIIGTTGSGKTQSFVIPSIQILSSCASKPSLVISDPKGELYSKNARKLTEEGYEIKVLNLRDPLKSTRWNPLDNAFTWYQEAHNLEKEVEVFRGTNPADTKYAPIQNEYFTEWFGFRSIAYPTKTELIQELNSTKSELIGKAENQIQEIAINLCPIKSQTDQSWERGAQAFIRGVILAMLEDSLDPELGMTREKFNFYNVSKICNFRDDDADNPFGSVRNYLSGRDEFSKVQELTSTAINNASSTTRSYMGIVSTSLNIFNDVGMSFVTSLNEMDFDNFADKPTALFIIVPDEEEGRHPIATMCIKQMYGKLIEAANKTKKQELPRNVYFILDEFANLPALEKFGTMITVARSRKIFFSLVVQSYSQLDTKYGKDISSTIRGNCNIQIYIGSDDQKTKEEFSKLCGDISAEFKNENISKDKNGNKGGTSVGVELKSRPLIYPNELGYLQKEIAVVKIYNEYPMKVKFTFSYKCPMFTLEPMPNKYVPSRSLDERKVYFDFKKRNKLRLID